MKIELLQLVENADGSADCELELDDEAKTYLINLGFISLLEKAIKLEKDLKI
jgi:hypothetical protein